MVVVWGGGQMNSKYSKFFSELFMIYAHKIENKKGNLIKSWFLEHHIIDMVLIATMVFFFHAKHTFPLSPSRWNCLQIHQLQLWNVDNGIIAGRFKTSFFFKYRIPHFKKTKNRIPHLKSGENRKPNIKLAKNRRPRHFWIPQTENKNDQKPKTENKNGQKPQNASL